MDQADISHHESDLYLKKNEISEQLVKEKPYRAYVMIFVNQVDGKPWYDVPFAYDPFWDKKNESCGHTE